MYFKLSPRQCQQTPQLFYFYSGDKLIPAVASVVGNIGLPGKNDGASKFILEFNKHFKLDTVLSGPR